MNTPKRIAAIAASFFIGMMGPAYAETSTESQMQSEIAALKARLAGLEAKQNDTWLNERRTEEVKNLIHEVLSDADTRASLLAGGATAGYNKGFFISSNDGAFLLKVAGQVQFRYIYNDRIQSGIDEEVGGFTLRRVKLFFSGHIGSPRIIYSVGLQTDRGTETVLIDHVYFGYKLMDGVTIFGGEGKAPFLREELTSSKRQLAVERSLLNEYFTAGRVQGVWMNIDVNDNTKLALAITDGVNSGEAGTSAAKDFDDDNSDFAFTARIDLRLAGEWSQMKDFAAWSGEQQAVFVGAAAHYERMETGLPTQQTMDYFFTWTVDGSIESDGTTLYAAAVGKHISGIHGGVDQDLFGVLVQGSVFLVPDKTDLFVRWEWMDPGQVATATADHDVNLITVGTNIYLNKHKAKFTSDIVIALNSLSALGSFNGSSGLGLLSDTAGNNGQIALRAQFQLLF